jgi:TPR repeat protein
MGRKLKSRKLTIWTLCILLIGIGGCQYKGKPISEPSYTSQAYAYTSSCSNLPPKIGEICYASDVEACLAEAQEGDVNAMEKLGLIYGHGPDYGYFSCRRFRDGHEASAALHLLSWMYELGEQVPRNRRISQEYIKLGLERGFDWALPAEIYRKAQVGDPTVANDLIKLAESGNCFAYSRLAGLYSGEKIAFWDKTESKIKQNLTKAYFWSLIRPGSNDEYWEIPPLSKKSCNETLRAGHSLDRKSIDKIPIKLIAMAEDAAATWTPGSPEPDLPPSPAPKAKPSIVKPKPKPTPSIATLPNPDASPKPPGKIVLPGIGELDFNIGQSNTRSRWSWQAVNLPAATTSSVETLRPDQVFSRTNIYVWTVFAARSVNDLKLRTRIAQGSAVAISKNRLITNCHVVKNQRIIFIKHGKRLDMVRVVFGDEAADKCVLETQELTLEAIPNRRAYGSLKVGEQVYTVGSPSGLENSLGEGLISGLRTNKGQRLVQTTAQISPGSSGGGLFDAAGRLIGITTFGIKGGQSLNFAIAAEEFAE